MSEDKQDSLLRSSVLVRLGDAGAETAKERDRRQRIRFRGRGLEHKFAEFATDTGMLVTVINLSFPAESAYGALLYRASRILDSIFRIQNGA